MIQQTQNVINLNLVPNQNLCRGKIINEILDELESEDIRVQAFKFASIQRNEKTEALKAIEKELRDKNDWIVVDLKPEANITKDLIAILYRDIPFLTEFINSTMNLSTFGIGSNQSQQSPMASLDVALKKIMTEVKKKKRRVLVVIDDAYKTGELIDFIQEFQILIREELPVFLLVAGIYDGIDSIETADGLTFFLRAEKYDMTSIPSECE